jgi:hypothetical protein
MEPIGTQPPNSTGGGTQSFIKHVFNFDDDSKHEMMNIIQYSLLAIIPVVILNKSIQRFIPNMDETKGSLEILTEVFGQTIAMFIGLLIIHRIIVYVPTYSKVKYYEMHVTNIILSFLVIVLSLQTKLGEKVNLLLERLMEVIDGSTNLKEAQTNISGNGDGNGNVIVTQPISNSGYVDTQNYQSNNSGISNPIAPSIQPTQQSSPDFQQMYSGPTTNLQNASPPNINNPVESFSSPLAANEALGGSSFGSAF